MSKAEKRERHWGRFLDLKRDQFDNDAGVHASVL